MGATQYVLLCVWLSCVEAGAFEIHSGYCVHQSLFLSVAQYYSVAQMDRDVAVHQLMDVFFAVWGHYE